MSETPWIDISESGYPQLTEEEKNQNYPQRLVIALNQYNCAELLMWNFTEQCWDDETGDDFKYHKEDIKYYMEIPEIPRNILKQQINSNHDHNNTSNTTSED